MRSLHKLLVSGLLIGGTATLIYAAPDDGVSAEVSITTPSGKMAQLSPAEMTIAADDLMTGMQGMLRHVQQLREKAAKEKDIIKLNCVNDKLMPMKAQVNLAEASRRQLDDMINAGDDKGRYASYSDLIASNDKVKDLRDEADACVGESLTYVGKTEVSVTGPDNPLIPGEDGFGQGIEPPTYRSPFD
jgi:hypothetical protein